MTFRIETYGKYFLLDRIAVGGMAEVFKAKTFGVRGFERLLVIKRILPHLSKDEEFVEMFVDEAKIAVELTHANICQVTDLGKIGDNYFIAMEFINGKDLRAVLKKCATADLPIPIPFTLFVMMEVCKGLDYAHRKVEPFSGSPLNLIHRDISPQNIMVSYHGEIKIVDFGIAKTESKLHRTQAGVLKGKFGYMSPEQASGLELDQRTDLFSTGIIFYEMLTGRRLFLGETDFKTLEQIKECQVPFPRKYRPEISEALEQIVLKSLAKNPEQRFATAGDMQVALAKLFYSTYPDFTANDISNLLQNLFKAEIEQEQEALKRALDNLPPQPETSPTEISLNRRSVSGKRSVFPEASSEVSLSTKLTLPQKTRLEFQSLWKTLIKNSALPWFRILLFGAVPFILAIGILYWVTTQRHPAPPKLPLPVQVQFTSNPPNALIYVDHVPQGSTPLSLSLSPGKLFNLRVEKEGFETLVRDQFQIQKNQKEYPFLLKKISNPMGILVVESSPPGAEIFYNGNSTGLLTPATLPKLPLHQEYKISLQKEGYQTHSQTIVLKKTNEAIQALLKPSQASLKLHISPSDATVWLNGKERGYVLEDLELGKTYELVVEAKGYVKETRKIHMESALLEMEIELKKIVVPSGTISINAIPWAQVLIDGKVVGPTPLPNLKLSLGTHKIIFRHSEYKEMEKTIEIRSGENPALIVTMENP